MSDVIIAKIEKSIETTSDAKTINLLAKAYHDVKKADSEYTKAKAEANKLERTLRLEELRLNAEIEDKKTRATLEQTRLDVDAIVRNTQVENDRLKIEKEFEAQMAKVKSTSRDNMVMAGATVGGIGIMYMCEKAGILLSRNTGTLFKFIRFGKLF